MKIIQAIMQQFKLDDVTKELQGIGVEGMTVTEVKGFGHQKGGQERYNGNMFTALFVPKVKIEVVVEDSLVQRVIDTITRSAKTDNAGDGRIFVLDLVAAVRIKTGPMCELRCPGDANSASQAGPPGVRDETAETPRVFANNAG